ncbi:nicotinate-nucleotide adenylyltransferase [Gorillibacterium massiliense]|uniref:nicotinate-nucleotide adenylyltransferase n=1 Tax=Gorillibacterium massiliense TaxID=1280390 RepID=UPI0004B0453D|nr:nicotinate-nucleotide adenylyltransferase [Gorillibacterium massiliense]
MKIGIMGGTFDPIHLGHLIAAERACEEAALDEVWFMPAHVPPHKRNAPQTDSARRLEMVELAVAGNPRFRASDFEIRRGGTSFTVSTMEEMVREFPDREFYYIIGADMVMYLPHWHRIGDLAKLVTFIGLARPGYALQLEQLPWELRDKIRLVPMPLVEISSTDIRARVRDGRSYRYLVSVPVQRYIEENRLYET